MAYSEDIANKVCERIAQGEPLRQICRDEGMPSYGAIYDWLEVQPEFASRFARARVIGFDVIAEHALEIADDDRRDWEALTDEDGNVTGVRVDGEHVTRSRLRIETRLKLLAKWDPKRYGERTTIAGDPDAPLNPRPLAGVSDQELDAALARLGLGDAKPG